jgi:hypothetical protein
MRKSQIRVGGHGVWFTMHPCQVHYEVRGIVQTGSSVNMVSTRQPRISSTTAPLSERETFALYTWSHARNMQSKNDGSKPFYEVPL